MRHITQHRYWTAPVGAFKTHMQTGENDRGLTRKTDRSTRHPLSDRVSVNTANRDLAGHPKPTCVLLCQGASRHAKLPLSMKANMRVPISLRNTIRVFSSCQAFRFLRGVGSLEFQISWPHLGARSHNIRGVLGNHQFLVRRYCPHRDLAVLSRYARAVAGIGRIVELDA